MLYVSLFLGSVAGGFVLGGATITGLHGLTHFDGLRDEASPPTLGMYGWLHLVHHRDIPHTVDCLPPAQRPGLLKHFQLGARGWEQLTWVRNNLRTHPRWAPVRLLTFYRTFVVMGVGGAIGLAIGGVGAACAASVALGAGHAVGTAVLMICYDLDHLWTHINGPRVSSLVTVRFWVPMFQEYQAKKPGFLVLLAN